MSIVARELRKCFSGTMAVNGLSLSVTPGEVYGLIGPNGAGKTTSMRMLAGLMQPSEGQALICGVDVVGEPLRAKAQLGFLGGTRGLYERLTAAEMLDYYGKLYGLSGEKVRGRAEQLCEELQMHGLMQRRCGTLSTGERQRVSLARAAIHDPPVLILDEPTANLDVLASRFVADFIHRLRRRGRAVIFSTHYMTEAELLCDRIGLLHRGRLVAEDTAAAIKAAYGVESLEQVFLLFQQQDDRRKGAADGMGQTPSSHSGAETEC